MDLWMGSQQQLLLTVCLERLLFAQQHIDGAGRLAPWVEYLKEPSLLPYLLHFLFCVGHGLFEY